ncbi:MAG TPA: site-specific tyrosine recombinase XerD [Acidimicrobiia bacterium]
MAPVAGLTVLDAIEEYLAALSSERGLAVNTISAYRRDLVDYCRFLGVEEPRRVDDVSTADVSAYLASLRERALAPSTVARRIAAVRGLHRFLVAEDLAGFDPTAMVDGPRRSAGLPKALAVEEVAAILDAPDPTTALGARDRALLEVMYASGCRVAEVVGLDLDDVDLDDRTARVTGKGSRQRLVPLGRYAVEAVRAYLPRRLELKGDAPDLGRVFLNARGRPMSRQAVWLVVRRHGAAVGIEPHRVSPHVLRHSAATHMVEGGADLRTVQEMLGHASISTTQIYTRVSPQHLLEVYVTSHPRSR